MKKLILIFFLSTLTLHSYELKIQWDKAEFADSYIVYVKDKVVVETADTTAIINVNSLLEDVYVAAKNSFGTSDKSERAVLNNIPETKEVELVIQFSSDMKEWTDFIKVYTKETEIKKFYRAIIKTK